MKAFTALFLAAASLLQWGPAVSAQEAVIPPLQPPPAPMFAGQTKAPAAPPSAPYTVETVSHGLVHPWSFAFLPDGRFLVTEKPGRLRIVGPDGSLTAPIAGVPEHAVPVLDLILAPDFAQSRLLYFNYGEPKDKGYVMGVVRARLSEDGSKLEAVTNILRTVPPAETNDLIAGRLILRPDGTLYVTSTSPMDRPLLQQRDNDAGKILRIGTDGSIPKDNPFVGQAKTRPEIWDIGHRDIQGAALHPVTGELWTVEHGPQGGDELNIVSAGKNYGWPVISYGSEYNGTRVGEGLGSKDGMEQPIYFWNPSVAPSGLMFYTGDLFPAWKGNLFVGTMKHKRLHRLVLKGRAVVAEELLLEGVDNRIRYVRQGPDGAIYLLTDEDAGRLLRLTPKK